MIDLNFIKQWEGCRLKAYKPLPNDKWTIGYGATGPNIVEGTEWSLGQAEDELEVRCFKLETAIKAALEDVPLSDKKMTALVSLAYNIGLGTFFKSTLFAKLHNNNASNVVAAEFSRWVYSGGMRVPGLMARRDAEKKLFLEEA